MENPAARSEYGIHANRILSSLGLTWDDIRKYKCVLDLGAGDASFAKAAREQGIQTKVVSVDRNPEGSDPSFVKADINHLPFGDGTFDLVISHASPPNYLVESQQEVESAISEARRVMARDGEFRFGALGAGILPYFVLDPNFDRSTFDFARAKTADGIRDLQGQTLQLLQRIDPRVEQFLRRDGDKTTSNYYRIKKGGDKK